MFVLFLCDTHSFVDAKQVLSIAMWIMTSSSPADVRGIGYMTKHDGVNNKKGSLQK